MMQGHFGAALAISAMTGRAARLPQLFIAAQVQDLLIAVLAYTLHIEQTRLAPGSENAVYPIELVHVPYSHSLFSTAALAALCLALPGRPAARRALALCVLSHWALDAAVHLPDLEVCFPAGDCGRAGLGLWRHRAASVAAESALVGAGAALYVRAAPGAAARAAAARLAPLAAGMVLVTAALPFLPPPPALDARITVQTFVAYALFAALAAWVERPVRRAEEESARMGE